MPTKSLSSEIAHCITELKKLKGKNPKNRRLNNKLQEMYDALHQAQGKEWDEQVDKYREAKQSLDKASKAAQDAINDLSKTADAIDKAANAIKAFLAALAFVL